ncbi:hypothetical protein [Streptomyces fagopyri]
MPVSDAPRTAWEAAQRLVAAGEHVHYSSEGEVRCLSGGCPPAYP